MRTVAVLPNPSDSRDNLPHAKHTLVGKEGVTQRHLDDEKWSAITSHKLKSVIPAWDQMHFSQRMPP